ncbi:NADH-ubiquinone oxidoreductase-F iron-sulfur binding region domain-containing protein [Natronomonas marina]|jgi:NADH-quinone oxidoreductase subunit F|uniref:NADH-ubiquinone oxidoreductase-F iron-sulfur binding region domain-containing protein n=1 Tax=Natronomonas marina TaxID=2961939 RepID=UPI0020C9A704|nr:NADH-ubiquinone oxidoreductase-F iron-sulfur binding region domain-containing protein [Natronomonas marina]
MTESPGPTDEGPTVRVAVGGPDAEIDGPDHGGTLLETARQRSDRTEVVETGLTGAAGGPHVFVSVGGRTALHGAVTDATVTRIVDACERGDLPEGGVVATAEDGEVPWPSAGPLSAGCRRVLDGFGWHPPDAVADPVAPRVREDPEAALATARKVGFRGRGRADVTADEAVADAWERARSADGEAVVVVHANDADPAARADRLCCAAAPGRVADAADAVAEIVGAEDVVAFAPASDGTLRDRLAAVDGWEIATAEGSFRVGEPTMALEALEGADRVEARRRPPGPEEWGLYGRPTLVHTPRTLLGLAELWRDPGAFDAGAVDPGTRLVSVGGDVPEPAVVEVPTDASLSVALGAVKTPESPRFVVGGRFGGLTRSLDVPASGPALAAAGLGTEGVLEALDSERCVVAAVGERAAFAREENCGRCVPCREGSKQLHEALRAVYDGSFEADEIRELSRVMATTSLCDFGETAARPVRTALAEFESEFRAHAEGRCPAGACEGLT